MAPTRMKLRVRRRDNVAGGAGDGQPAEEEERRREGVGRSSRRKSTSSITATVAAASSSSPPVASASARAALAADEASPDSKCPICLDRFNNLAYLDRCLHRFCFPCIQEWSHNKPECPLCKQPFTSILHSVRAEDDFKEYTLRPAPASSSVAATVAMVAAMASAARSDHQMRMLLLRRHRVEDGGEAATRRRRRERVGRAGERTGVLEWYLDSHQPHPPGSPEESDEGESIRRGAELAERGVIFEGLTGLGGAVAPVAPNDRTSRRLMTRLATRQRLQREGGTVRRLREREMVAFRRALYRCGIRVHGVAGVTEGRQQRDITAESFRQNPAHLNRLRPWLRRELTVLYGAHGVLVHIVQRIIMARLARHGLEDAPTIEEELRPFLLARTDHFLHELVCFARSPLSLDGYDLQAVYEPPTATMELDGLSSSSDSSSVISISEGEDEERRAGGRSEERPLGAHDDIIQSGSCLSLSAWDDETPGPSYSTAEPSCSLASLSFSPVPPDTEAGAEKREEAEEECLIVGYKKPIAERTPELVQLSSDTEDNAEEEKKKEETTPPPSHLPAVPPSTSGAYRAERDGEPKEKENEAVRSCSGSSGRSHESVLALSPERRQESWRDRKQSSGEVAREKRRRRKRRRGLEKSSDWLKKSGTLYNPNRSIYPAMMRRRSPSPFHSSADSVSPLPPSPPDSSWEYNCSPLTSSVSSPSRSFSSSPLSSSPQPSPPPRTPPTPSLSPVNADHGEKPGGKRKYKSRHLDSNNKDPTWRPSSRSQRRERKRRRKAEKERRRRRGRRREGHRKESGEYGGESSSRRCREDRSPSVEIIYEGTVTSEAAQPPACKRRRKRHRKTQHSSSPVIITLDSDSSRDGVNNNPISSSSSSPISSQQTVDFSDLPPLPLVHSSGVGGALDAEIGELPVDILDRGSEGSETEPVGKSSAAGPIAIDNSDNSDPELDVENVEEGSLLPSNVDGSIRKAADSSREPTADTVADLLTTDVHKRDSEVLTSDNRLLATILNDLKGIAAPKCDLSLSFELSCSPETRRTHFRNPCRVSQAHSNQDSWLAEVSGTDQSQGLDSPTRRTSIPLSPPLEQPHEGGVREEGTNVPPQASPVQSSNKNALPPFKHKDGGNPHLSPISLADLRTPPPSDADLCGGKSPGGLDSNSTTSPVGFHLAPEVPKDNQAIPPISALKRHFRSTSTSRVSATDMHPRCHLSPVVSHSLLANSIHSSCIDSHSSSLSENSADSLPNPLKLHSSIQSTSEISSGPTSSCIDLHPVNSLFPIDFHSAKTGWSMEDPARTHSTSGGLRNKTLGQNTAEDTPPGSGVSSQVNSNYTSPLVSVSSIDSRTQKPDPPFDSHFSNKRENLSERLGVRSVPPAAPGGRSAADAHFSRAASEVLTSSRESLIANHQHRSPHGHLPLVDLHCTSPAPPDNLHPISFINATVHGRVNHAALSSSATEHTINFHTSHRKCTSQSEHAAESHSNSELRNISQLPIDSRTKNYLPTDSQPPNDFHPNSSLKEYQLHADNHFTSSPADDQWDSPSGGHPDSQSPVDERSASGIWTTHAPPHRTNK